MPIKKRPVPRTARTTTRHVSTVARRPSARRRRAIFWTVLGLVIAGGLGYLGKLGYNALQRSIDDAKTFAIARIDVTTSGVLTVDDILREADVAVGRNIWSVDAAAVRARLEDNPLVARAEVARQMPDTLRIVVTERVPVARLTTGGGGTTLTTDREGHVMGPSTVRATLPEVTGLSDPALSPGDVIQDPMLAAIVDILELCRRPNLTDEVKPTVIDISDRTRIRLLLQTGDELLLSTTGYEDKLQQFPLMRTVARDRGLALHTYDMTVDKNFPATP